MTLTQRVLTKPLAGNRSFGLPPVADAPGPTKGNSSDEVALRQFVTSNPVAWRQSLTRAYREQFEETQFAAIAELRKRMKGPDPDDVLEASVAVLRHVEALI